MTLIISPALVLSPAPGVSSWWPIILWQSLVTVSNIEADSEETAHPVTNLANPATSLKWVSGGTSEQLITVLFDTTDAINAVGIARHNLGSTETSVSVEGLSAEPEAEWETIIEDALLGDDSPALLLFPDTYLIGLRLRLKPTDTPPEMAVLYVGEAFRVQFGLRPGFTPIMDGQDVRKAAGVSEGGDYLGEIVLGEKLSTTAQFDHMERDWYREYMRPFVTAANRGRPFFFAALPTWYPREVGFCWLDTPAKPRVDNVIGATSLQMQMTGIAS